MATSRQANLLGLGRYRAPVAYHDCIDHRIGEREEVRDLGGSDLVDRAVGSDVPQRPQTADGLGRLVADDPCLAGPFHQLARSTCACGGSAHTELKDALNLRVGLD